jgi:multidrug efflux system outer membrane protein
VRRAEREYAAATARIGAAMADRYPKFSLTAAFGLESVSSSDFADAASRAWSIGPAMRWPLLAGGSIEANIEIQDARAEQARIAYDRSLLVALEDVENALVDYLREWDHRRALESAAAAGRKSVDLADQLYRSGLTNFLDVLDAERGLYEAELDLAQSEVASSLSVVSLYKALGGGWETFQGDSNG